MKELIDITFDDFKDIANIATNGYITDSSSFNVVEVSNTPTSRKLEYNLYGEKKWLYPLKSVRLYMMYKDYVDLLSSQYGVDMLNYFNSISPVDYNDTPNGKYIYLSELYDEHKQILELFNCVVEYIDGETIIKRYFEISIVNNKWYLYHGQYDENGSVMLFIIFNEQGVKDYCVLHDINCKL